MAGTQILGGRTKIKGMMLCGWHSDPRREETKIKGMMLCGWHSDPRREDQDKGNDAMWLALRS